MTQQFMRYSPDVERTEPEFDRSLRTLLENHQVRREPKNLAEVFG
jgi:hypothetical protein